MGWMDMLNQVVGGGANPEHHFDQIASNAPQEVVGKAVADAFRSDQTPPYQHEKIYNYCKHKSYFILQ